MIAADQQILVGVDATLTARFLDQDGDFVAPTEPVTVTVTTAAGTALLTDAVAAVDGVSVCSVALPAVDRVDRLTCVWESPDSTVTTTVEVAGGYYASISAIREADPTIGNDDQKFSRERLLGARRFVEEEFERFCNRAFVPRFEVSSMADRNRCDLTLPHVDVRAVRSVTVDGEIFDVSSSLVVPEAGVLRLGGAWPSGQLVVAYEHGMDRPPASIVRAFYTRIRNAISTLSSGVPDRASTYTGQNGQSYSLLVAGRGGSVTALPEVDVALREWQIQRIGIG